LNAVAALKRRTDHPTEPEWARQAAEFPGAAHRRLTFRILPELLFSTGAAEPGGTAA
jgi:hypothetical protein